MGKAEVRQLTRVLYSLYPKVQEEYGRYTQDYRKILADIFQQDPERMAGIWLELISVYPESIREMRSASYLTEDILEQIIPLQGFTEFLESNDRLCKKLFAESASVTQVCETALCVCLQKGKAALFDELMEYRQENSLCRRDDALFAKLLKLSFSKEIFEDIQAVMKKWGFKLAHNAQQGKEWAMRMLTADAVSRMTKGNQAGSIAEAQEQLILELPGELGGYKSEPIPQKMKKNEADPFSRMLAIAPKRRSGSRIYIDPKEQFYQQAESMKDFEGIPCEEVHWTNYWVTVPTYAKMNRKQLQWYFYWRARVRQGELPPADIEFVYLYAFELLNQIGVQDADDGMQRLVSLYHNYGRVYGICDRYLFVWIHDYILYYGLDMEYLRSFVAGEKDMDTFRMEEIAVALETDRWDGFLGLVEDISSYHFEKSRFYREKASWLEEAFRYVVRDIRGYFQDKSQSLTEKFIGKPYPANWTPFGNAPVLLPSEPDTVKIYVNRCESYRWKRGRWMGWRYYDADERFVGQIIRETERILRQLTGYPYQLKATEGLSTEIAGIIQKSVETYCLEWDRMDLYKRLKSAAKAKKKEEKQQRPPVVVDPAKFQSIREAADKIQEKLVVEEEEEEMPAPQGAPASPVDMEPTSTETCFTERETAILKRVLEGEDLSALAKEIGVMPQVLAEEINEKAIQWLGDTVLEEVNGVFRILEDYVDDVRSIL